jgi:hypothetical protein
MLLMYSHSWTEPARRNLKQENPGDTLQTINPIIHWGAMMKANEPIYVTKPFLPPPKGCNEYLKNGKTRR